MGYSQNYFSNGQVLEHTDLNSIIDGILSKQDILKSGVNIKSINGISLLGEGNIETVGEGVTSLMDASVDKDTLIINKSDGSLVKFAPLDEDNEFIEEDARLNANTVFASSYNTYKWGQFKGGVPSIENDYIKIECSGALGGIRRSAPTNIPIGTRIRLTFYYKKDSAYTESTASSNYKFYVTGTADNLTFTDEWKKYQKDYVWDGSWDRIQISSPTASQELIFYVKDFSIINMDVISVRNRLTNLEKSFSHPLYGKNIAVIGDSISTGGLNPYFIIRSVDVGKTIQSYVTHYDIYVGTAGTLTNKTIGGVLLTDEMIGTMQSFVPTTEDIGKKIGLSPSYYNNNIAVWHKVLKEKTGAARVINASWSGSRLHSGGDKGDDRLSTSWSDYTIGKCKTRDDEGNDILPDVIFIYRGTNDYSKSDPFGYIDEIDLMKGIPETDVLDDGRYSARIAYYLTIKTKNYYITNNTKISISSQYHEFFKNPTPPAPAPPSAVSLSAPLNS